MREPARFSGTLNFVYAHWPYFAGLYGGMILMLLAIGYSLDRGWLSFVPLATAVWLILGYLFCVSIWHGYQLYDLAGLRPYYILFDMASLAPEQDLVYIDVGLRQRPIALSRRLTSGRVVVVDIYTPQWMPSAALARWRQQWQHPPVDPRLNWRDGRIDLLPVPDNSVEAVMLCQICSEIWQDGDRELLLREVWRILKPNGRLLLAEPSRTQSAWAAHGLAAINLPTPDYWHQLLATTKFRFNREQDINGHIYCIIARKPAATEGQQLAFDLRY